MPRDEGTLLDMARACRHILEFTEGVNEGTFVGTYRLQALVQHELMILGEAAKRLSTAFRAAHPELPLKEAAGMRDRLIHAYDDVDPELVWEAATRSAPELLRSLEPLLPPAPQQDS